jgi:rRNA maturation endonuclease Nob1
MGRTKGSKNKNNLQVQIQNKDISRNIPELSNENKDKYFIPRNYARSNIQPLFASSSSTSTTAYPVTQIENMLKNPYANFKQLQLVSEHLINTNSNYNNVVDYFANILALNYILFPFSTTDNVVTVKNRIYNSAKIISKMQIESMIPTMIKQAIIYGESFWYDLSDSENTIIVEIPRNICVLSQIDDDNLWRYYVDLSLINSITVAELPEEIQAEYKKWTDGGKKKSKKKINDTLEIPDHYYEVSKKGFAIFIHGLKKAHDYPLLVHMFTDLSLLNTDKSYFNEFIKDDAVKTIHQKVPVDKDTGVPTMPKEIIEAYHNSSKEHVGKNISIMTNPFEVEGIALDKNQQSAINVVEHDIKVINNDSGISETIFNASTTNGLGYSTKADSNRMFPILSFFVNLINYKLKQHKCQIKFLNINAFEQKDWHTQYGTDLLNGGLRSLFISTSGIDIYTFLNTAEMEKMLDFDEWLPAKMNASQLSVDDLNDPNNKGGTPKKDPKKAADSTNKVNDYK